MSLAALRCLLAIGKTAVAAALNAAAKQSRRSVMAHNDQAAPSSLR
jgi:hypothetical protein